MQVPSARRRFSGSFPKANCHAVKSKRLSANPAKGVENLPRKTGNRPAYLSADDVYRLADESGQHRTLVLVLAYTSIRWGGGTPHTRHGIPASSAQRERERRATWCQPRRRSDQGPLTVATIERYQTSSSATLYMVRYRKPDSGQTMKRGFATKRDAQLFAATVEVSKAKGEYVAPKLGRVTRRRAGAQLAGTQARATAPSHYRMLESAWRVHVQPHWGTVPVADVDLLGGRGVDHRHGRQRRRCYHGAAGIRRAVGHPGRRGERQTAGGQPGQGCGEPAPQDGATSRLPVG